MNFDLSNVLGQAQEVKNEADQNQNNGGGGDRRTLIYPQDGAVKVKLLYNPKSGIAIRKFGRHHVHGTKVPCLQMYGQDCPICKILKDIKSVKGTDLWEFKRKDRGLSYAQYIADNYNRKQDEKAPEQNEIILLMYPWSVYRDLQSLIAEAGQNANSILATNVGKIVKLTRSRGKNNRVEYRVELDAFGDHQSFGTDQEYVDALNGLPNLNDEIVASSIDEKMLKKVNEIENKLRENYLAPSVASGFNNDGGQASNLGNFNNAQNQGQNPDWMNGGQPNGNQGFDPNQGNQGGQFNQQGNFNNGQNQGFNPNQGQGQFNNPNPNQGQGQFNNQDQFNNQQQFNNPNPMNNQGQFNNQPNGGNQGNFHNPASSQGQNGAGTQDPWAGTEQPNQNNFADNNLGQAPSNTANPNQGQNDAPRADGKPDCFAKHGSVSQHTCLVCPHEVECVGATQ